MLREISEGQEGRLCIKYRASLVRSQSGSYHSISIVEDIGRSETASYVGSLKFKMFCRIQSGCFVLVVAVLLIFALGTEAQLNFSTGWGGGKRSQITQSGGGSAMCSSQGKPSLNQLLALYNLIQNEAQKILDCQKYTK